jgi:ribosomal protein S18 acetylase RimI-like enzyme
MIKEDTGRIAAITEIAWSGASLHELMEERHGSIGNKSWKQRKVDELLSSCEKDPSSVIVAVKDNSVVGYATFSMIKEDRMGYVLNNAVDPAFQGKGIGTALNRWILDHFRNQGIKIVRVTTLEKDRAAQRVYEKNGFKELARSIHYSTEL